MGEKESEAEKRVFVQQREAESVSGENQSKAAIVVSNSELMVKEADAKKKAEIALRHAQVEIQKSQYSAELERLTAEEVVKKEIEKRKIELEAQAEAEKIMIEAKGRLAVGSESQACAMTRSGRMCIFRMIRWQ